MVNRPPAAVALWIIGVWMTCYGFFTIFSSHVLNVGDVIPQNYEWVEFAFLQQMFGVLTGIAAAVVTGKASKSFLLPAFKRHKQSIIAASIFNVMASLAVSAAFTIIPSRAAHVVKTCQPLVTMLILYKDGSVSVLSFLPVSVIVLGISSIPLSSDSFYFSGFLAAVFSLVAFSARNVLIKNLGSVWEGAIEKFLAVSIVSTFLLFPPLLLKGFTTKSLFSTGFYGLAAASASQSVCGISSFQVLEMITPVSHAILSVCIRLGFYVNSIDYDSLLQLFTSFAILSAGLFLYWKRKENGWVAVKRVVFTFSVGIFLIGNLFPTDRHSTKAPAWNPQNNTFNISMVWFYDEPITAKAICNIRSIGKQNYDSAVHVYCKTTQCVDAVRKLDVVNVFEEFALIDDIVKSTPFEEWVARHPINKMVTGKTYVAYLRLITILGVLWKYGEVYVNPVLSNPVVTTLPEIGRCITARVDEEVTMNSSSPSELQIVCSNTFLRELHRGYRDLQQKLDGGSRIQFNYSLATEPVNNVSINSDTSTPCPNSDTSEVPSENAPALDHYSVPMQPPSFEDSINYLSILQYFPFVDHFEGLKNRESRPPASITVLFDSELGGTEEWPPSKALNPIMLSVRVDNRTERTWGENIDYFKAREPIGCRDTRTLHFMQQHNVAAFFSGPLSLLMTHFKVKRNGILVADLEQDIIDLLPSVIQSNITHSPKYDLHSISIVYKSAYQLVEMFALAKVVVTQNSDYAFLCVALKTPVILIWSSNEAMDNNQVLPLCHNLYVRGTTKEQTQLWLHNFPWQDIPQNPNLGTGMRLKITQWDVLRQNSLIYQEALRHGTIPMAPLPSQGLLFHLIFTTTGKDSIVVGSHTRTSGGFNWRHLRTIESIFYHHPASRIIVHSNTLSHKQLDVFTEVGYSIQVQKYDLKELLKGSPAASFAGRLRYVQKGQFWYSHQTDLLRLLLLYKYGGVYMDTDMILVRPLTTLPMNVLGFQDNGFVANGALMMFSKDSVYIRECLKEFASTYNGKDWSNNGPKLLTRVWFTTFKAKNTEDASVMSQEYFYLFTWRVVLEQGFKQTSGKDFERNMKIVKSTAYAVHLNSKITGHIGVDGSKLIHGTIGSYLLNSFCILCNRIY